MEVGSRYSHQGELLPDALRGEGQGSNLVLENATRRCMGSIDLSNSRVVLNIAKTLPVFSAQDCELQGETFELPN